MGRTRNAVLSLLAVVLVWVLPIAAQDGSSGGAPTAVPASRQADNVAIITIKGPITAITELSVKRRIKNAEDSGANAMVFEIDSPGGAVGAVLAISGAIKASSIQNTVAWINPQAYSGGAIIGLACREIVTTNPASFGDALLILQTPFGIAPPTATERTKMLPPLLSDAVDSARRNGFDEYLAQAIGTDGIELWAVRDAQTGDWLFINEIEYSMLFDGEPPRSRPVLAGVPEGATREDSIAQMREEAEAEQAGRDSDEDSDEPTGEDDTGSDDADLPPAKPIEPVDPARAFRPATPELADLFAESGEVSPLAATTRPQLSESDRGRYVDPVYVCDGTAAVVLSHADFVRFGLSSATINNDAELQSFFGAKNMTRTNRSWSEHLVSFLTLTPVRGILIVVFLLGLFIEMTSPGMMLPGGVALGALVALLAPPALIGMAGWWEIAAIGIGICLILIELLVLPGFGVFGILGLVALFGGLVGTFIPDGSGGLFPDTRDAQTDALFGVTTVVLAVAASGVGVYFIAKHFGTIPFVGKLVLSEAGVVPTDEERVDPELAAAAPPVTTGPRVGAIGEATTPLRPSGSVEIDGDVVDAVADGAFIEAGVRVILLERRGFSWVVEPTGGQTDSESIDSSGEAEA
ncbi:MAG: NfeD family protein [Planctomycetota bacterium]